MVVRDNCVVLFIDTPQPSHPVPAVGEFAKFMYINEQSMLDDAEQLPSAPKDKLRRNRPHNFGLATMNSVMDRACMTPNQKPSLQLPYLTVSTLYLSSHFVCRGIKKPAQNYDIMTRST